MRDVGHFGVEEGRSLGKLERNILGRIKDIMRRVLRVQLVSTREKET